MSTPPSQGTGSHCPRSRFFSVARLLPLLMLLVFSVVAHAQTTTGTTADGFSYTGSYATVTATITGYSGTSSSVIIPNTIGNYQVRYIQAYAFSNCSSVTSVTIPANVWSADEAFSFCPKLTSITVDAYNYWLSSVDGVLFSKGKTTLLQFPTAKIGNPYTIPDSVTTIGMAFHGCTGLTSITLPNSVRYISWYAFYGSTSLASVTLSSSLTSIGSYAFYNCTGLTSITIPDSVTTTGTSAFSGCTKLTSITIPNTITTAGTTTFAGCTKVANVTISPGVTTSGSSIGAGLFSGWTSLTNVTFLPGVTKIGDGVFSDCTNLVSVTIPDSVTTIGNTAFWNCTSLTNVALGNGITSIGTGAFCNCYKLTGVTIPDSVTAIGDYAFSTCALTSLTIPSSVTTIGTSAFGGNRLTSLMIPGSVISIGSGAFYACPLLKNAIFSGNAPAMGVNVFGHAASGFAVYYFDGATGFTSPTWNGYPAVNMGATSPVPPWLLSKKLAYNADLKSAPNGDGVPLLLAYALNLDPTRNQSSRLPRPVVAGDQMSLTFYAGSADVTYTVESSADLQTWDTTDVTTSTPDANNLCTATLPLTGSRRFMRLVVHH